MMMMLIMRRKWRLEQVTGSPKIGNGTSREINVTKSGVAQQSAVKNPAADNQLIPIAKYAINSNWLDGKLAPGRTH